MKRVLICIFLLTTACNSSFAYLTQGHWRWRNNDGTEKTATWKAPQDSSVNLSDYKALRLRAEVYNNTSSTIALNRSLQYATSVNGPWTSIDDASGFAAFTMGGNNSYITNNDSTTQQIADPAYPFLPGNIVTTDEPYTDSIYVHTRREYEWCIKPSPYIQPNTTYYFKSNAGSDQPLLPSLTTTGTAFVAGPQPILSNGGFETNTPGWTTIAASGSAATFSLATNALQVHSGSRALLVNVINTGAGNSVTLTHTPVMLNDTGTYMLRFWALAKQRNAYIDINLQGATSNTCHFQIYNRFDTTKNGWQMYQYVFKGSQSPVTLQMSFNTATTYNLDDIEIVSSTTNPNINLKYQYDWQNNFAETYGWISGDNDNPVLLPDSSRAWAFNDSFMGAHNPHSNVLGFISIIHNLLVIQNGDQLASKYGGTAPNAQTLFSPGNGNTFFNAGGLMENDVLKVLLIEENNSVYAGHTWVGTLSLPGLNVTGQVQLPAAISSPPNCVFQDGNYDYLYIPVSTAQFAVHTVVGRVPKGQLDSQTPWQYYTGDTTWSTDFSRAKTLLENVSAGSVVKLGPNNYAMSAVPTLSYEIDVWFAPSPVGPWRDKTSIYNIPQEEDVLPYEGHIDPLAKNGIYTLSYSIFPFVTEPNGTSGSTAMQIADKTVYTPCYVKANLLQLSPYTPRAPADTLSAFTAVDVNQKVQLKWVSTQTTDDHFDVQRSFDGTTWQAIATVEGSDSTSLADYQAIDANPANGINYYRIAQYDIDSKLTLSVVRTVNTLQTAVLASFTATADAPRVRLDWTTSSELNNKLFTVERSTDGVSFTTLTTVAGSGTTDTIHHYETFDGEPFNGINYYRLSYFSNGKDTTSVVRKVDMSLTLTLNVYPNPTSKAITFALKGYKGSSIAVTLTDMGGRVMDKETFAVSGDSIYTLQARPSAGAYIIKVNGVRLARAAKVLVQ